MSDTDYIEETSIKGVFVVQRPTFEDQRGFFRELYRKEDLEKRLGYEFNPVQPNHSRSGKGDLRGIHVSPWEKLVTVTRGEVQQVVVDLREDSPTFGQYLSFRVGDSDRKCIFIPKGVGNAFLVLSEVADYVYMTTGYWGPGKEMYVTYKDPDINIAWEDNNPDVSEKDLNGKTVRELFPNKF